MNKLRLINASTVGAIYSIWTSVVVTIYAEFNLGFKDMLKSFTGHHWVTKSWLAVLIFALIFLVYYFAVNNPNKYKTNLVLLNFSAILGALAIFGFYVWHY